VTRVVHSDPDILEGTPVFIGTRVRLWVANKPSLYSTWRAKHSWPMRVLLEEQPPVDLASHLLGHAVETVVDRGWAGITNGELLRRMTGYYDALITMDRGIEFQQPVST
jgi:hypothetical protein